MKQRAGTKRTGRFYAVIVLTACAAILLLRPGCHRDPPDLTACTRIDVHYGPGALDYFFPGTSDQERILSEKERQCVQSYDVWTVIDLEQIRAFAHLVAQGEYRGRQYGIIDHIPTDIICYQGSDRVASLAVYPRIFVTKGKCEFAYPGWLSLKCLDPPALKPLQVRWKCATNLSALVFEGLWSGRKHHFCPDPNHWCDVILEAYRRWHRIYEDQNGRREREFPDPAIARRFTCPGADALADANNVQSHPGETDSSTQAPDSWVSDYGMNSNCRDGSPDDMVFLFESQPGWNQHGGPELFTFDNHDPRGGCVLLHDGTVKFIRSEEELQGLRWK